MIDIIVPIWKPIDWTSFDVVKKVRSQIKPAKVGHAGTLDPFAEGVLMLCTGSKTKLIESFMNEEKEYIAKIILNYETDTLDLTGKIISSNPNSIMYDKETILNALSKFKGDIMQEPPMYSALKYNGQPLYKLARKGEIVERVKRKIKIYDITLLNYDKNELLIKVRCGRGTYIRSLALDIAKELGTVGYLHSLIRTRIGEYNKDSCVKIEDFSEWLSSIA